MAPLKVLISGAGIAGPALASLLVRITTFPCTIVIVERHPSLRSSGQQIDLRGQGVDAMRAIGIEPQVRRAHVNEPGMSFVNRSGKQIAFLAANKTGKGRQSFSSEFEIMRGDLCQILCQLTESHPNVTYKFGTSVTSLTFPTTNPDSPVSVRFSDGTEDRYDLVVGADGVGSKIRRLMNTHDNLPKDPFYPLGFYIAFWTIPPRPDDPPAATCCHLPGRRMLMTRRDRPDCLRVYFGAVGNYPDLDSAFRSGDLQSMKEQVARLMIATKDDEDVAQMRRFLDGLLHSPLADDFYGQGLGQIKRDSWSSGRVVLLGDAGYCPSPASGLGTTVGLVGAWVLAGELAKACSKDPENPRAGVAEALRQYETTLGPFVHEAQQLWVGAFKAALPETKFGIAALHWILWGITTLKIDKLAMSFSDDKRGTWDLPKYPELN
ncbi:kynurenine 3-monooxygenase [Diplogelasinospora grovesii]|uniref:Kynurenine 3-monooxygenase n=1 Tax=Diplogelasinospora grovesii TaxID=303347 RepID=A0AAN6N1C8_9PEZI|nr:kynurenine 3-monooxygenase [Diplogelasinospora grovesii]